MPVFEALMKVTHNETWAVEAKDAAEARKFFEKLSEDVETDETGGEVVDWEVLSVKVEKDD